MYFYQHLRLALLTWRSLLILKQCVDEPASFMDPFSTVLCIVVVVLVLIIIYIRAQGDFIGIYTGHVILKTFLHNVE